MTRLELLKIVVLRARANGFEFRRWYTLRLGVPWTGAEAALLLLEAQRRYYALLFSHEFACAFWKAGEEITFAVPAQSYEAVQADGTHRTVQRKAFMRRSARRDAWKYHLREMALAEDPLRYIRKYLNVEDELESEPAVRPTVASAEEALPAAKPKRKKAIEPAAAIGRTSREKPVKRALPKGLPEFLKRPYPGAK